MVHRCYSSLGHACNALEGEPLQRLIDYLDVAQFTNKSEMHHQHEKVDAVGTAREIIFAFPAEHF